MWGKLYRNSQVLSKTPTLYFPGRQLGGIPQPGFVDRVVDLPNLEGRDPLNPSQIQIVFRYFLASFLIPVPISLRIS